MTIRHICCNRWTLGCLIALILPITGMRSQTPPRSPRPVTDPELLQPDPADWLMWRRTLNSWGYSPLKQIDKTNVDKYYGQLYVNQDKFLADLPTIVNANLKSGNFGGQ